VGHLEARGEPFRRGADQPLERWEIPVCEVPLRRLPLDDLPPVLRLLPSRRFSMTCSGPGRPRSRARRSPSCPRARDLVEVAGERTAVFCPSNLQRREKSTVRMGTLIPPRGCRCTDDLEQAALGELLDEHAVLGRRPAWCTPIPCFQPLADVGPVGLVKRKPVIAAATAFFSSRVARLRLVKSWALSAASRCVKWTTVDGRFVLGDELLERLGERDLGVRILERHRPLDRLDHRGRAGRCGGSGPRRRTKRRRESRT